MERGWASNVPMQPRRDCDCGRPSSTVFQVTKRGDSSMPSEVLELAGVVAAVDAERQVEEVEVEDGVDAPEEDSRSKMGFFSGRLWFVVVLR